MGDGTWDGRGYKNPNESIIYIDEGVLGFSIRYELDGAVSAMNETTLMGFSPENDKMLGRNIVVLFFVFGLNLAQILL